MTLLMLTVDQYAERTGRSVRQIRRYLADGRIPGAVSVAGRWSIPADALPVPAVVGSDLPEWLGSTDLTREVVPETVVELGPNLGTLVTLEDAAADLGTSVGGVRRLGKDGHLIIGPYGRGGALRVWVP